MKPVVWPQYPFSPLGVRNMGAFPYTYAQKDFGSDGEGCLLWLP